MVIKKTYEWVSSSEHSLKIYYYYYYYMLFTYNWEMQVEVNDFYLHTLQIVGTIYSELNIIVGKIISVGKTYTDRLLAVIIHPLKVDGRNVHRTKSIIHLATVFSFTVTIFVRRYRSFFLQYNNYLMEYCHFLSLNSSQS